MFHFFQKITIGIISAITAFTGAFHVASKIPPGSSDQATTSQLASVSSTTPLVSSVVAPAIEPVLKPSPTPIVKKPISADTVLCNGVYWSQCPTGQNLVCPATGDATCVQISKPASQVLQQMATPVVAPTINQRKTYPIIPLGNISSIPQDQQYIAIDAYNEFSRTPDLSYMTIQQQRDLLTQITTKHLEVYKTLMLQKTAEAKAQLDAKQKSKNELDALTAEYNKNLNDFNSQIVAIKQQYLLDVDKVNKDVWFSQPKKDAEIEKLTNDANYKIQAIIIQEQDLKTQYLAKVNAL